MLSRKQFFSELIRRSVGAAARLLDGAGSAPGPADEKGEQALAFTELSPALLAMEADRLAKPDGNCGTDALRQQLYLQMKQQVPAPGPDSETDP